MSRPQLSIVIVSFNTKDVLKDCLESLEKVRNEIPFEVIVSDNGSTDGSREELKDMKWIRLLDNKSNLGFSKGNNKARSVVAGKYVLFLNPDTVVKEGTLGKSVEFLEKNKDVGSMTCRILLPSGEPDPDTVRAFPTPWVAFSHFSGLDRLFPNSKFFAKYWYGYLDKNKQQLVDVIQGAFHLTRKAVLDEVGWFDEDYFLDGEDIDLCWKIQNRGYKVAYFPDVSIVHVKKASKRTHKSSLGVTSGMRAMETFYRKRLWDKYPVFVNYPVIMGIKVLLGVRLLKFYLK